MDKFISCVVLGPSQWFFHFGKEIVITWTHIGWERWMFQNLPLLAAQEVHDSSSVTPSIVMKNDGVLYHQVSLFSPECWSKVVLQKLAVVGSVYHLPWRYSMVHQCHMPQWTSPSQHFLWMRGIGMLPFIWSTFQVWFVWVSPGFIPSDNLSKKFVTFSLALVQQGMCDSILLPL